MVFGTRADAFWHEAAALLDLRGFMWECLLRHKLCDWGDVDKPIVSSYKLPGGEREVSVNQYGRIPQETVWIMTERDRSATTIMWPSEY